MWVLVVVVLERMAGLAGSVTSTTTSVLPPAAWVVWSMSVETS